MIRLILIILFFLVSLLAICKAPAYYLWLLAIGVTEFPLLFAGITALLTLSGIWVQKYQLAGTVLGLLTFIIFLSPIARAYIVGKSLKKELATSLGIADAGTDEQPFGFLKIFSGNRDNTYKAHNYVSYPGKTLSLDFYPAFADEFYWPKPCVIVIHGGSWAGGDSQQLPELNSYLAAKGYNVASINYRMAPKYQTPAPVEDVKAAIAYLRKHADELHINPNSFVLLGRSAGAQIALLAAYTLNDPGIKGVIDFYGPADMVWGYSIPSNPLIMDSRKVMEDYIGGSYQQAPQKYIACSPIEFVSRQSVPTLLIHGNNDVLVAPEHSRRLDLKLQQNGIKHYWLKLPWATHGFDYNLNGPGGQLSTYAVEMFLKKVSTSPPTP